MLKEIIFMPLCISILIIGLSINALAGTYLGTQTVGGNYGTPEVTVTNSAGGSLKGCPSYFSYAQYMIEAIKLLIFFSILLYASYCDIKTREVPDFIHLMILITGFIGITNVNIPSMIIGFLIIPLPLFYSAVFKEKSIGGADIKFMAACSFLLGLERGLVAIIVGLLLAVIISITIRKIQKKDLKDTFPIVPYLAMGSFVAFFL